VIAGDRAKRNFNVTIIPIRSQDLVKNPQTVGPRSSTLKTRVPELLARFLVLLQLLLSVRPRLLNLLSDYASGLEYWPYTLFTRPFLHEAPDSGLF